jgi:hypothetical protein
MGNQLRLRRFEPEPEDPVVSERVQARAFNRRVFREMVKSEIGDGGLDRRRRNELIRFAESVGIDDYEAHLLLRAVEYECCLAGPGGADARRLPGLEEPLGPVAVVISLLTAVLIGAMAIRVLAAMLS